MAAFLFVCGLILMAVGIGLMETAAALILCIVGGAINLLAFLLLEVAGCEYRGALTAPCYTHSWCCARLGAFLLLAVSYTWWLVLATAKPTCETETRIESKCGCPENMSDCGENGSCANDDDCASSMRFPGIMCGNHEGETDCHDNGCVYSEYTVQDHSDDDDDDNEWCSGSDDTVSLVQYHRGVTEGLAVVALLAWILAWFLLWQQTRRCRQDVLNRQPIKIAEASIAQVVAAARMKGEPQFPDSVISRLERQRIDGEALRAIVELESVALQQVERTNKGTVVVQAVEAQNVKSPIASTQSFDHDRNQQDIDPANTVSRDVEDSVQLLDNLFKGLTVGSKLAAKRTLREWVATGVPVADSTP
jgi:hypothetical protein